MTEAELNIDYLIDPIQFIFPAIKCVHVHVSELTRNNSIKNRFAKLFDRAEFPTDGALPILNRKVFKARRVSIREHPYVVSIRRNVAHYSVGCILTKNVVLTVAFPLIKVSLAELSVVVGENYADRGSMLHTVILIIEHENFNPFTLENDIAMLRIFEDITFKGSAKAIPLIYDADLIYGRKAFVTGWGRCDRTGKELCLPRSTRYTLDERLDPMLRTVTFNLQFENKKYCSLYQPNEVSLPPGMLCLGESRQSNPAMPCLAVPGAPLAVGARLAAILSWGFGCCHLKDLPLIYTDIKYFLPWIDNNLQVMRNISKAYLLKLFQAQRAFILKEWLNFTRVLPAKGYVQEQNKHMMILRVDKELAKFLGNVYDIRDYLFDGELHNYKTKMYAKLREISAIESDREIKSQQLKLWFKKQNETLKPFINENSDTYFESTLTEADDEFEGDDSIEEYHTI
ncbi:unnamed protein product [Arctia plantaginis]|uniref:Peptidase S1 domain-containing protein n=1 Tax=Arctia plantaginis TaxID=874455 RepID=A0A8S0YZE3_ARCPL|nr:unnamed protein product [Arctia plantaginis]